MRHARGRCQKQSEEDGWDGDAAIFGPGGKCYANEFPERAGPDAQRAGEAPVRARVVEIFAKDVENLGAEVAAQFGGIQEQHRRICANAKG